MSDDANHDANKVIELSPEQRDALVEKKATCPFLGGVVAEGKLAVRNAAENPLASIEDVRKLGNSGGGDLGDLLVLFASGNHAFMAGASGKLDKPAPSGLFSLELPGSQGSHAGHSGILEGDPELPGSGRLSQAEFARLIGRAKEGLVKRSDVGRFIAQNLFRDAKSKVFGKNVATLLAGDLLAFVETVGPALMSRLFSAGEDESHRDLEQKLTKLLGEDNLVGSVGEFGLLFAFRVPGEQARRPADRRRARGGRARLGGDVSAQALACRLGDLEEATPRLGNKYHGAADQCGKGIP
jgi:hypothetical protein